MTDLDQEIVTPEVSEPSEKMVAQSKVEEVAGRARREGYEKAIREQAEMLQRLQAQQQTQAPVQNNGMSRAEVERMVIEAQNKALAEHKMELQKQRDLALAQKVVSEFSAKMQEGPKKYEDFEQVVTMLGLQNMPEIVQLVNSTDNAMEIMYELGKYPGKAYEIKAMIKDGNIQLAQEQMSNLSNSITKNQQAASKITTREPLSQHKRSTTTDPSDPGSISVADMRRQPWLRV